MIQVLLLILKIIGITLLTVFGLLFVVLAAVLFAPIFYRVRVIHNPERTQVKARISFLFPFVFATVEFLKKLSYKVRIFGIAVLDSEKPKKEKKPKTKKPKKQKLKKQKHKKNEKKDADAVQELNFEQNFEPNLEEEAEPKEAATVVPKQEKKPNPEKTEKKDFFTKIRSKIQKIRETIRNIIDKIKKLFRQKEEAQRILAKPETKTALKYAWDKLKRLLKHILPRKVKGYVAFGTGDPASTGQALGILSILYARTGEMLTIRPNFMEKQLESDVELKGRIQVFTLLVIAVKVILNQELKQLLTEVKGLKEIE